MTERRQVRKWVLATGVTVALGVTLAARVVHAPVSSSFAFPRVFGPDPLAASPNARTASEKIVNGAKAEARRGVFYDASYRSLHYPGGDVAPDRGACTDVIVRSLRAAGYDLQALIHEDMQRHFSRYPRQYGLSRPDPNIDHRRTPNHIAFFRRHGLTLTTETSGDAAKEWQPGDLVYCRLSNGMGHCGVVSNVRGGSGLPMVIHNMGVTRQEDVLAAWEITDHFRYPPTRNRGS